ncbi:hypothetical protein PC129_g23195 [Phytophthora cactorum]|uniref:RxLR effector protein n=1 Tax=Phytophthora cactorum TaxID=29920 RepID=A0A329RCC2_9STRA|nr:hypothetical protein Pcac1_g14214 [Phytophthora cactorum]KAG2794282.1 hypothetical protein PC111_g22669 [Phytophthora cactorum]KAG2799036.1 hypothetical protein PC112_g21086 [Phytophthora cactorum]KAG2821569.1 hypothetical protein PC113_g22460 [Phytophthora cactorum]KAG2883930.1 hypothetical protein PC114_g20360 [Phytophthora cactorum]
MRLSYVLFLAAASLVATIETTSALSSGVSLPKPNGARIAKAHVFVGHDSRFLRAREKADIVAEDEEGGDDEEEARMIAWTTSLKDKANAWMIAKEFFGKGNDEMMAMASKLNKDELNLLFHHGESHLAKLIPGYVSGMNDKDFVAAIRKSNLPKGQQGALEIAYLNRIAHNS